jgi:hypothetical protein
MTFSVGCGVEDSRIRLIDGRNLLSNVKARAISDRIADPSSRCLAVDVVERWHIAF